MTKRIDSSVRIGKKTNIAGSAIGSGASVSTPARSDKKISAIAGSVVVAIIVGWITNYIYDWTTTVWHLLGHGQAVH